MKKPNMKATWVDLPNKKINKSITKNDSTLSVSDLCTTKLMVQMKKFNKNFVKLSEDSDLSNYRTNKLNKSIVELNTTMENFMDKFENFFEPFKKLNDKVDSLCTYLDNLDYTTEISNNCTNTNNELIKKHINMFEKYMDDSGSSSEPENDSYTPLEVLTNSAKNDSYTPLEVLTNSAKNDNYTPLEVLTNLAKNELYSPNDSETLSTSSTSSISLVSVHESNLDTFSIRSDRKFPPSYMDLARWALYSLDRSTTLTEMNDYISKNVPKVNKSKVKLNITHDKLMRFNVNSGGYMTYTNGCYTLTSVGKASACQVDIKQFNK
jgi:uncharacterized coiled-coil protein SlyX